MELKYKVGDRVKIKTWEVLEQERGLSHRGNIMFPPAESYCLTKKMESIINSVSVDRIFTIEIRKEEYCYYMEGIEKIWAWSDYMIEGLVQEKNIIFDSIEFRFELMDFDG